MKTLLVYKTYWYIKFWQRESCPARKHIGSILATGSIKNITDGKRHNVSIILTGVHGRIMICLSFAVLLLKII